MEPLTPNDPLWKLMGKARQVQPRGNFTQNVLRAARVVPQDRGWFARLKAWFEESQRTVWVGAAATAVVLALAVMVLPSSQQSSGTAASSQPAVVATDASFDADMALIAEDYELPLDNLDHVDALIAMEDTSSLSDSDIAFLLY